MEENAEQEIKFLLGGVIPERDAEMKDYLDEYAPYFTRCDDRPGFVIEAGAFGIVKFTQRTMHLMWLLGFAANQALHAFSALVAILRMYGGRLDSDEFADIPDQAVHERKYRELIESVQELAEEPDAKEFTWPGAIACPDGGRPTDTEGSATFDLICMSGAYVFLHEMKHIAFASEDSAPNEPHEEELACDQFAEQMMLGELESYSRQSGYDLGRLKSKRAMSITLALFYMLVITPRNSWSGTETHPSIKKRIISMVERLSISDDDVLWLYMSSLFLSHLRYIGSERLVVEFNVLKELALGLVSKIESKSN